MGQLAFGVAGAVVGAFTPVGPALGWAIGSAIGGVVFAPDGAQTTGPRLDDLRSNVSTYGQPIPRAYGQIGFMGSLIWMHDTLEVASVAEDGKGGDPATATTFTYFATFASILCRGEDAEIPNSVEVANLNRMWINEQCFYDVRDETNIEAMIASANFARYFTFYYGSQTQEPDPTMESIIGVGNVPAYRGRAYCVFSSLPLSLVQNQPPGALRIKFEVTMTGSPVTGLRFLKEFAPHAGSSSANESNLLMPVRDGVVRVLQEPPDNVVWVNNVDGTPLGIDTKTEEEEEWPTGGALGDNSVAITRLYDGSNVRAFGFAGTAINHVNQRLYCMVDGVGDVDALPLLLPITDIIYSVVPSADERTVFVFTGTGGAITDYHQIEWDAAEVEWILIRKQAISGVSTLMAIGPSSQISTTFTSAMVEANNRWVWWFTSAGSTGFHLYAIADDFTMSHVTPILVDGNMGSFVSTQIWTDNGLAYAIIGDRYYVATRLDGAALNDQTLQDVFEAETALGELEPFQVDGSFGSTTIVDGMVVRRIGAPRGVLGALEPAYFWDTVETSGVLKGVFRGGASVVTITEDELGASIDGTADEDLINPERTDEDSLPGEAIVVYIDRGSDYQVAAQHDRRSAVETDQPVSLEMPLVLTPDDARQVAAVWIYNQWAGRTRRTVRLSRKYSYLEPTDVITLTTAIADFTVRIVAIKTNEGYVELECVDEDAALYLQNSEGADIDKGTVITLVTPTRFVLLDIPMLRESDDDAGFYVAIAGYTASWPGAMLMRSTDGGVTYSTVTSTTTAATLGIVPLALGNYTGVLGYDSVNEIIVTLFGDDTLESCTDAELLGGANPFALGSPTGGYEIAQFKTATLVTGKTWRLRELLRGRRGTEHEMAGHGTYETFVLLEASKMRRIGADDPDIGVENHFKAVTFGQPVTNAAAQSFTNTAAGLKPYSPVDARGAGFGGDITITWTRRGRIYNDWRDGIELPLGEASEAYVVEIWNAGNTAVLRTVSGITSPTTTYSSANQVTDFGVNPSTLNVRIFQISAIVGRGFPLIATLS